MVSPDEQDSFGEQDAGQYGEEMEFDSIHEMISIYDANLVRKKAPKTKKRIKAKKK